MTKTTSSTLKSILCPVDFSPSSEKALLHVAERHARDAELVVLHVGSTDSADRGALLKEHLHHFSRYSDMLSAYRCDLRFAIEYGSPAETIIKYAKKQGADLIVLGSHGANNITRLLVGSTTEKVMRQAPCQVLVLKSPRPADAGAGCAQKSIAVL
jgi:nucleotide-binding universal stress UspA family protein